MPTKTEQAITQMKLAFQYLEQMDKINEGMQKEGYGFDIDQMRKYLDSASKALDTARKLDPNAVYEETS